MPFKLFISYEIVDRSMTFDLSVTWMKGVRELSYTKRHRILVEGADHYMFQITSTLQTDPGQYIVMAENSAGKVQATIWVNILPRDSTEAWVFTHLFVRINVTEKNFCHMMIQTLDLGTNYQAYSVQG